MKSPLSLTITLTIICILSFLFELAQGGLPALPFSLPVTYYPHAPLHHFLFFHFCHVNVFHLLANILALWFFKPRVSTVLASFIIASLCAYVDTIIIPTSTCGLSAFLFAAFARRFAAWKETIWKLLSIIILTGLIPTVNWHVHLLSFLASYLFWFLFYACKAHKARSPH